MINQTFRFYYKVNKADIDLNKYKLNGKAEYNLFNEIDKIESGEFQKYEVNTSETLDINKLILNLSQDTYGTNKHIHSEILTFNISLKNPSKDFDHDDIYDIFIDYDTFKEYIEKYNIIAVAKDVKDPDNIIDPITGEKTTLMKLMLNRIKLYFADSANIVLLKEKEYQE